jgi:hypothetical protein
VQVAELKALRAEDGEKEAALQVMIDLLREQEILREQGSSGEAHKEALERAHRGALEAAQQEIARLREAVSQLQGSRVQQEHAQGQLPVAFNPLQKACAALVASCVGTAAYLIAPGDISIICTGAFWPLFATHPAALMVLFHPLLAVALLILLSADAVVGRVVSIEALALIETAEGGALLSALRWQAAGIVLIMMAKAAALITSQGREGFTAWDASSHLMALAVQGWGARSLWTGQMGRKRAAA